MARFAILFAALFAACFFTAAAFAQTGGRAVLLVADRVWALLAERWAPTPGRRH
jgi:hypothetical protein